MFNIWTHINTLNTTVNHFYIVNPTVCYSISNIFSLWGPSAKESLFGIFSKIYLCAFYQIIGLLCTHIVCLKNKHPHQRTAKQRQQKQQRHPVNICHRLFWNIIGIPLWVYACGGVHKWMCAMSTTTTDCCAFAWDSQSFRWFFSSPFPFVCSRFAPLNHITFKMFVWCVSATIKFWYLHI